MTMGTQKTERVSLTIEVKVPVKDWIEYLTQKTDIFLPSYIGYWALGVRVHPDRGWLVFEDPDGKYRNRKAPDHDAAVKAWESGAALPPRWHRLDKAMAIKAFVEGVKLWGERWFDDKSDDSTYDTVLRMAMLGEERYG